MPASASSSSLWPLPLTPATPTISPARTSKLTSFTRATPLPSTTFKCATSSTTAPTVDGVGIDLEAVGLGEIGEGGARLGRRRPQQRRAFDAEHDVLQHREIIHQHEMLMHHADARGDGIMRAVDAAGPAADPDLAGIG